MWKKIACAIMLIMFCVMFPKQIVQAGMEFSPIINRDIGDKISFTYSGDNWQIYSFVPEETGYYYCLFDISGVRTETELQLYAEGEEKALIEESNTYARLDRKLVYLAEGRVYSIQGKVKTENMVMDVRFRKKSKQQIYSSIEVEQLPAVSYTGEKQEPKPRVTYKGEDASKVAKSVNYSYSFNKEPGVAVVTIVVQMKRDEYFDDNYEVKTSFLIRQPIQEAEIIMPEYVYAGAPIVPQPTVKIKGKTLTQGVDYTLEVMNNTQPGTGIVKLNGIGKYEGSVQKAFTIQSSEWKIECKDTFIKNKKSKSFQLNAKSDGKLFYSSNNKKVAQVNKSGKVKIKGYGTAAITITAKADQTHTDATATVNIIVTSKTGKIRSVKKKGKNAAVVKMQRVSDAKGYEISYSLDKSFQQEVKKVTTKKKSAKIKSLKSGTTYYFRVRTYRKVKGKKLYSDYSKVKTYRVKK